MPQVGDSNALWYHGLCGIGDSYLGLIQYKNHTGPLSFFLTHLPLKKMAAILADDISKCIFLNEKLWFLI